MKIDTIVLGDFEANCYCVRTDETASTCMLIDPGMNPEPLIHFYQQSTPEAVIDTQQTIRRQPKQCVSTGPNRWPSRNKTRRC